MELPEVEGELPEIVSEFPDVDDNKLAAVDPVVVSGIADGAGVEDVAGVTGEEGMESLAGFKGISRSGFEGFTP